LENKPAGLKSALAHMSGVNEEHILQEMESFSLLKTAIFKQKLYAPILQINGKKDTIVTIHEIDFLDEQKIKQDALLFDNDRHVASRNWFLHENFAAEWLAKKLNIVN
jgi:hypothetical protein